MKATCQHRKYFLVREQTPRFFLQTGRGLIPAQIAALLFLSPTTALAGAPKNGTASGWVTSTTSARKPCHPPIRRGGAERGRGGEHEGGAEERVTQDREEAEGSRAQDVTASISHRGRWTAGGPLSQGF